MEKLFFFFAATFCAASMSAEIIQRDIPLDETTWNKGWKCSATVDEDGMHCTTTDMFGAIATGWEPSRDLSPWEKLVIVVTSMNGCAGDYYKLTAFLRDSEHQDVDDCQYVDLGLDAPDNATNKIEFDLTRNYLILDVSKAHVLGVMCDRSNAKFTISRVYLERDGEPDPEIDGIEQIIAPSGSPSRGEKILLNGDLYILRDGKIFNAQGARVK